ncbi:hypothetical protein RvY_15705 [Ramazzottius varieornatus]|uniref:Major facilitator superfamily (MFS) profile domain-containing protein n=1 Tax=Ramazzottius varieornatus TaxID=947166 RepID=A0A1D1VZ00_RAMVA|nr:hypothetical protein RvY_15705 [Ramazzottius varieornatus]
MAGASSVPGFRDVDELANTPARRPRYESVVSIVGGEEKLVQVELPPAARTKLTKSQISILIAGSCSSMFMHMAISSMPLILPPTIIEKGISYGYTGVIFSVFAVSIAIFEPLQAKIIPFLGTKRAFVGSSFVGGLCYLAFAFLDYADTTAAFVAPACIIRFIEGIYYAILITSSNVIVCLSFPDRASFAFGVLEGFVGVGFTFGPVIGGTLYREVGFYAPFVFIGVALLLTAVLGYFSIEQISGINLEARPREKRRLIRDPAFIGCGVLCFSMGVIWGIFETALEPYLATYDRGPGVEALVFAIAYLAYAGMAPVWGYVFRKVHIDYRWVLLGPVVIGVVWMVLGPIPGLSFIPPSVLWLDTVCLFLINVGVAYVFVFSYDTMLKRAIFCGLEENVATYALIVASFFTSIYLGEVVGPIIGGAVYSQYNFQYVAAVASGTQFGFAGLAAVIMLIAWKKVGKRLRGYGHSVFPSWIKSNQIKEQESEESSPLNSNDNSSDFTIFQPATDSRKTGALNQNRDSVGYGSMS